jgi:hypothetical protein
LTTRYVHANILILKLYSNWPRVGGTPIADDDRRRSRSTSRLRLVAEPQEKRGAAEIIDDLLVTVGAGRLAQMLVECVHTQADHLAMAGRADDALALRRYARVISRAARELTTATKSNAAP